MRTRIKICGITRPEDAMVAVSAGVDAIGLVFYPPSPRFVSLEQAVAVVEAVPAFVTITALFVDPSEAEVNEVIARVKPSLLQFHGDEPEAFCAAFGRPYIKALRVRPGLDVEREVARYHSACGVLLDAYRPGVPGGTGEQFDWELIPPALRSQVVLAGGLSPGNVRAAIAQVLPYAVDVSGGVEATKGIKDHLLIQSFVDEVGCADRSRS